MGTQTEYVLTLRLLRIWSSAKDANNESRYSKRIQLAIQDLLDLQKNGWKRKLYKDGVSFVSHPVMSWCLSWLVLGMGRFMYQPCIIYFHLLASSLLALFLVILFPSIPRSKVMTRQNRIDWWTPVKWNLRNRFVVSARTMQIKLATSTWCEVSRMARAKSPSSEVL